MLLNELDLAGILLVVIVQERLPRHFKGLGVAGVDVELAALKGVGVAVGVGLAGREVRPGQGEVSNHQGCED